MRNTLAGDVQGPLVQGPLVQGPVVQAGIVTGGVHVSYRQTPMMAFYGLLRGHAQLTPQMELDAERGIIQRWPVYTRLLDPDTITTGMLRQLETAWTEAWQHQHAREQAVRAHNLRAYRPVTPTALDELDADSAADFCDVLNLLASRTGVSRRELASRAPSTGPNKLNPSQLSSILDPERSVLPRKLVQVREFARACGLTTEQTEKLLDTWARLNARKDRGKTPTPATHPTITAATPATTDTTTTDAMDAKHVAEWITRITDTKPTGAEPTPAGTTITALPIAFGIDPEHVLQQLRATLMPPDMITATTHPAARLGRQDPQQHATTPSAAKKPLLKKIAAAATGIGKAAASPSTSAFSPLELLIIGVLGMLRDQQKRPATAA